MTDVLRGQFVIALITTIIGASLLYNTTLIWYNQEEIIERLERIEAAQEKTE